MNMKKLRGKNVFNVHGSKKSTHEKFGKISDGKITEVKDIHVDILKKEKYHGPV